MNDRESIIAPSNIEIRGAKVHNLKNIDVDIPIGKFCAVAGVSGSGKSSLALGVLYAEGSRRYLEALSTYTRRRLTQAAEAKVESVENIPAALALHQRPAVPDIRSTFGTSTELLNSVRLMFSRLGSYICPNNHRVPPSINVAFDKPLICSKCNAEFPGRGAEDFAFNSGGACPECSGTGIMRTVDDSTLVPDESKTISEGAVAAWNQFGTSWMYRVVRELGVRIDVPYSKLTAKEKNIVMNGKEVTKSIAIPTKNGKLFDLNAKYLNAHRAIEEGLRKATSEKSLTKINRFLKTQVCDKCDGDRISQECKKVLLCGKSLPEVCAMPLNELVKWIESIPNQLTDPGLNEMAKSITGQFLRNAKRLLELGLGYLTMDRAGSTLSTGERQRVQLARAIRNKTTGVLYILDEPSIGLHPSNMDGLLGVIYDLIEHGNSVVMVDHDVRMLKQADWLIELGPGAGVYGGNILAKGTVEEIIHSEKSLIGEYLSGEKPVIARDRCDSEEIFENGKITLKTLPIHTVKALNVQIPKGKLTVVTGVSGSGKTTMVLESLIPAVNAILNDEPLPEHVKSIKIDGISRINLIDATPIGANVRSTVATYSNIMDKLRKIFADQKSAKKLKLKVNDFSYNTGKLRCETCDGTGVITMDVQFLPDVDVVCTKCNGLRYGEKAGKVHIPSVEDEDGISLPDIMGFTINQFAKKIPEKNCTPALKKVKEKLETLQELGIGYLTLGEGTPLLSGGEAQRLKLAAEMGKAKDDTIYVFDEPTIGLHPLDVAKLIEVFDKLVKAGATVIVIEHDLDMILNADYIIDMGPEGGEMGGEIVVSGTVEQVKKCKDSITGRYL
ncbi:excinuclease ABC A subunit UvrA2 [Neocallimastix sp. 'constans']|jgi:excinuclease ABC subunit A